MNNDTLILTFNETLEREGFPVLIGRKEIKVFARRTEKGEETPYLNVYSRLEDGIKQGFIITLKNQPYLVQKVITKENDVYNKCVCVECNQVINFMLRDSTDKTKATLNIFNAVGYNISESIKASQTISTINSSGHFTLPLNEQTKQIGINERFFAGGTNLAWQIRDIYIQNGMVEVYCDRDNIDDVNDDIENEIADRWKFEQKEPPVTTDIAVNPPYDEVNCYKVLQSDTVTFTCSCLIDSIWEITLNSNGIASSKFVSSINNANGTFTVTNKQMENGRYLIYTIAEKTTGKSIDFNVKLGSLF